MLEDNRIDISEGIDVNKTNASKECDISHFWYLKILVLSMSHIFVMVVMIYCKKPWVLMMLLLFMLKELLKEFTFGIWAKVMEFAK